MHETLPISDLSEGAADLPEVILRDVLVQVPDVQLQACQGGSVAEDDVGLRRRVLGLLLLQSPRFSVVWVDVLVKYSDHPHKLMPVYEYNVLQSPRFSVVWMDVLVQYSDHPYKLMPEYE